MQKRKTWLVIGIIIGIFFIACMIFLLRSTVSSHEEKYLEQSTKEQRVDHTNPDVLKILNEQYHLSNLIAHEFYVAQDTRRVLEFYFSKAVTFQELILAQDYFNRLVNINYPLGGALPYGMEYSEANYLQSDVFRVFISDQLLYYWEKSVQSSTETYFENPTVNLKDRPKVDEKKYDFIKEIVAEELGTKARIRLVKAIKPFTNICQIETTKEMSKEQIERIKGRMEENLGSLGSERQSSDMVSNIPQHWLIYVKDELIADL